MMQKNFTAFIARSSMAIKKNLDTDLRKPVLIRTCELLRRFDDYLQDQAINKWVEDYNLSKMLLVSYLNGIKKPKLSPSDELKERLLDFDIRQNEITGELSISQNKKQYTIDELTMILDSENFNLKHFDKFINADNSNISVTKIYNPLQDFFKDLADKYKGEKLISELSDCIPAMDFNDKTKGHYQNRLKHFMEKWLYKAAGQALGISKNDAMLLWVEPLGGSGKSYINRWLFSLPEFENYYMRIGENASFFDMSGISKGKFAIDWDELPLSQKRYLMFKSYIAAEGGQAYNKKSKKYESYIRQVNFIGSTNKANRERQKGFLLDDDDAMKRRIIPIDLYGRINYQKYTKDIDLYQLWGEASAGIMQAQKANNKKLLTWESDWDDLREQNSKYVNNSRKGESNLIISQFKPCEENQGRLISATDMIIELKKKSIKIELSPEQLGHLLTKFKFEKGLKYVGKNKYRGYWVAE